MVRANRVLIKKVSSLHRPLLVRASALCFRNFYFRKPTAAAVDCSMRLMRKRSRWDTCKSLAKRQLKKDNGGEAIETETPGCGAKTQ
jgi:hypothetical protein